MSLNKLFIFAFLFITANAAVYDRVKLRKDLRDFLGTLERYEHTKNDVVFLLDESGSIGFDRFQEVKLFTNLIARQLSVSSEFTRVAVVTFSTGTISHIDYIKNPYGNNMCTLLSEIENIGYVGDGTRTSEAMKVAENILALARRDSNKIIFLLSDGQSNDGYSPVRISHELKSRGIIIFAIGVADVNKEEIEAVATTRSHTFILDDFDYIVKVNKFLINDTKDSLDLAKNPSSCKSTCDAHAKCYCGARSGVHECSCDEGYHGTNGREGECKECPKGTYKSQPGNYDCTPCPLNSTTLKAGRTSFHDCMCDMGFEKVGNFCLPIKCAPLSAPAGGLLIPTHCNNTYGTVCSFKCGLGHCPFSCNDYPPHLADNHVTLPKRTCLENGRWSNEEFHCEKITCPALSYPINGKHNCSEKDFTFGSTCHFTCEKGYDLYGPESRSCGFNGWSGHDVKCKVIHCSKVKTNDLLVVKPINCSTNEMPYRSICRYHCKKGYDLVLQGNQTDGVLKCEADKKWSQAFEKITCKDSERPKIKCPKSITVNTNAHKDHAFVTWDQPNATDNVGVADIRIIEPKGLRKPPYVFPIKTTKVVYEVIDYSKLRETCPFNVTVLDKEPPKVVSCPSDIEVYHDRNTGINITWDEPKFEDNSKHIKHITQNKKSGDLFGWGPAFTVVYSASDAANNRVNCSFSVKVKHYPCPYYEPPANGLVTCDNWGDGRLCSIFCHEGFEFASSKNVHFMYLCNQEIEKGVKVGRWKPFKPNAASFKMPWPDCTRKQKPTSIKVDVGISYSVDSCSDEVLQKMREQFFNRIRKLPSIFCPVKIGCSAENVKVTCNPASIRRKRSFDSDTYREYRLYRSISTHRREYTRMLRETSNVLTISFNMQMFPNVTERTSDVKSSDESYKEDEMALSADSFLKEIQDEVSLQVKNIYNMTSVPKTEMNYGITAICSMGQISVNKSCMNCPLGTYKDDVSESCIACPSASYQDEERQPSCKPCPVGYTTYGVKSKSLSDCKGPCQPGTYSETTFEPCLACPMNTYQDRSGRKECTKCPSGLYTWRVGANSSSDCVAPCKPGTFSDTGYEPCSLCDIGSFQEQEMQKECTSCPNRTSTTVEGSSNIEDCKEIDICNELSPCEYNSTCIQLDKEYECICPKGLLGKHCEINHDDCESSPCLNNGTCIDGIANFTCICLDGWEGHQCETNRDDCESSPCLNGGQCFDKINSFECECKAGFTGDRCEKNVYECESNPCLNNGTCFDMQNDYRCCCSKGYFGKSCEKKLNISVCDTITCENGGTCLAEDDAFACLCFDGFEGEFCEFEIDYCKDIQCENGGICINGIKNATCSCPSKFIGLHCEEALFPQFVLSFPTPDTSNYAKVENHRSLYAVTVSFFMRTDFKDSNSRPTPVSYSYKFQDHLQDNALTLLNTNNLVLYIHGEAFHTEYAANSDALWHHYAVTWGSKDGSWVFYVDGKMLENGNAGRDKYFHPGVFILGQEQDDVGGRFSTLEAFAGDITEFNVWDYELTEEEITLISSSCGYIGNVIPWYILSQSVYGDVMLSEDVDKCKAIGSCPENSCDCFYSNTTNVTSCKHDVEECIDEDTCANKQPCISNDQYSFCNCSSGFEGRRCEYDVDECLEENGGCNYICINDVGTGSYHCECPEDMVLSEDGKTCKDTSYCLKDGQIYVDGENWVDSCQNCICDHGVISCEEILCNVTACFPEETLITSPGECCPKCVAWSFCLISPNNTLTSFDMSSYHIEGECMYTAVEDCVGGHFKVQIESPQDSVNDRKLIIYQDCYKITISSNGSVLLDDNVAELPIKNEEIAVVEYNDSSLTVETHSALLVQWNLRDEVVIAVPITDLHKMCGVCSRIEDYFLHSNGKYPLMERFASGENECSVISEAFQETTVRTSDSLSIFSSSKAFPVVLLIEFVYLSIRSKLMCSY